MNDLNDFFYIGSDLNKSVLYANEIAVGKYFKERIQLYLILKEINPHLEVSFVNDDYHLPVFEQLCASGNVFANVLLELRKHEEIIVMEENENSERPAKKRRTKNPTFCKNTISPFEIDCYAFHISFLPLVMGNADYRREFLKLEMAWLYVRFMNLSESSKQMLVNIATRAFVKEFLYDGSLVVPFQYAGAVVGKRLVEFNNGLATVPVKYHFEFVQGYFRDLLLKAMQDAAPPPPPEPPFPFPKRYKPSPRDNQEDVLLPYMSLEVFQSTRSALISMAQNEQNRLFTIYDERLPEHPLRLKDMNVALFPPCMRAIVHELEANNHARYGSRTQLTIFLRNIGVPYEDAVAFWKKYFLQKMDCDKFNKNYLYYIKHTYGLVGSRFNYRQRDCVHLMKSSLVGCPFKNWSAGQMKKTLSQWNPNELTITDIEDIVTESQKTNYQQACALHCTKVHGSMDCGSEIANPCEYYENAKRAGGLISFKH